MHTFAQKFTIHKYFVYIFTVLVVATFWVATTFCMVRFRKKTYLSPVMEKHIDEKTLTKMYYTIGEVAKMFDVNTSLLRFWEKDFPNLIPKKTKNNKRLYTPKEIMKIDEVYVLVKKKGFTLDGAKMALKNGNLPTETTKNDSILLNKLLSIRAKLNAIKNKM